MTVTATLRRAGAVDTNTSGTGALTAILTFFGGLLSATLLFFGVRLTARSQERQKRTDMEAATAGSAWHAVEEGTKSLILSLMTRVTNLEASDARKSEQINFLTGEVSRLMALNEKLAEDNQTLVQENEKLQELNRELRAENRNYHQQIQALTEASADAESV